MPQLWKLPPVHLLICVLCMFAVRILAPYPWLLDTGFATWSVRILFALGFVLPALAAYEFFKSGTNIEAFKEPDKLITSGIFTYTRNPIYLGFFCLALGTAFQINHPAALLFAVVFFLLADRWYIPHEEEDATRIFEDDFNKYKSEVRRWL